MSRGEGVYLFDTHNKNYLDFAAGIAVNSLGHSHPAVLKALHTQADRLWHCSNIFHNEGLISFSQKLVDASFADSVFFCSSGTEANEAGLKFVRRYFYAKGQPKRNRLITFEGGFHGRTMAMISAGGNASAREGFTPLLEGFDRVAFEDLDAVRNAITDQTAGIFIEPVQGEGGVRPCSKAFLQGLRQIADEHGLLLWLDEVQCGVGRPGTLFAYEQYGIKPDLVTIAKGIGAGYPLAAVLVTEAVASALTPSCHGSTYGSNPLAMAVGEAVLNTINTPAFLAQVREVGSYFETQLKTLQQQFPTLIKDVRGLGLMLGVQLHIPARAFATKLLEKGLVVAPAEGDVLRLMPPLIVEPKHIDEAVAILAAALKESL